MNPYRMGARVYYADANATVSNGAAGIAAGTVNGEPIRDGAGAIQYVPVFTARDHGREPTTVFVAVSNIVGVER